MTGQRWGIAFVLAGLLAACQSGAPEVARPPDSADQAGGVVAEDQALYESLFRSEPQPLDRIEAAIAFRGVDPASIAPSLTTPAETYEVGDVRTFWVHNNDTFEYKEIDARLMLISKHAYFWQDTSGAAHIAGGLPATDADWQRAADTFDASYEAVRATYGEEVSPGIDGDARLYIVHSDSLGVIGGYFGELDQLPSAVEPHSNEGEYFYISNSGAGDLAGDYYNETLAHEFQHMIAKNIDPNEDGWMNEGMSVLAQQVAGMRGDVTVGNYLTNLDQSLWYWAGVHADYGHSYLFLDYLYEQLGPDFIKAVVAHTSNGLQSIDATLVDEGSDRTTDSLYGDFAAAVYFHDPSIDAGQYSFANAAISDLQPNESYTSLPATYDGAVNQYGGIDVVTFKGRGEATITFRGVQTVKLLPTDAQSGRYMWWGNRADASISTLTRAVDLSGVSDATLTYWTWYDIEKDWDYAYVMVSADGGETWQPQASTSSTEANPNDNNYGQGITGRSGGAEDESVWMQETVDLSAYAGQSILLRFAMINDLVRNEGGFAIDDMEILQIGWHDDAESGEEGWMAEGFVRIHNRVPQLWSIRVAEQRADGTITILAPEVVDGQANVDVNLDEVSLVTVIVVGQTRFTNQPGFYAIEAAAK